MQVLWSYQPVIQIYSTLFLSFFTNFSTLTKLDLGRAALCVFHAILSFGLGCRVRCSLERDLMVL